MGQPRQTTTGNLPGEPSRSFAREVAACYLEGQGGDAEAALLQAVADGIAAMASASRGFLRLGPPAAAGARVDATVGRSEAPRDHGHEEASC